MSESHRTSRWQQLQARPLAVIAALAVLVLVVILARSALDVVAALLVCGTIVLLERTVGDWFAARLGPIGGNVLFVLLVTGFLWALLGTDRGQDAARAALRIGSDRGFHTAVVSVRPPAGARANHGSVRQLPGQPVAPAPSPVLTSDGPVGPRGGVEPEAGVTRIGNAGRDASRPTTGERINTQVTVRALPSDEPRQIMLQADVIAGPNQVTEGIVEFSLNGRVVARVPLRSEGGAEARMANVAPGYYRVTARFAGTADFREATSETSFTL